MCEAAYKFLYENAGPVIKAEAAKALGILDEDIKLAMLQDPTVEYWLSCTQEFYKNKRVHDAFDTRMENWMHKLISFSVEERDDPRLKEINETILEYMTENAGNEKFFDSISNVIAASYLARMGHEDDIILSVINERIDAVYDFAKNFDYDIYADKKDYPKVPKARDKHPLVKTELYQNNVWQLPTVHDMFAFSGLPRKMRGNKEAAEKIEIIVKYIMKEGYQRLPWGYGLMLVPPKTYYGMGWSVKLSRYFEDDKNSAAPVVWETELMSHFKAVRETTWFKKRMEHLMSFGEGGLFEFPSEYLSEGKDKYYVGGGHMGLGENRRKKLWRKVESTAWMLRILANI